MVQRIMYTISAGVAAFVVVAIGALGAYLLLGHPATIQASPAAQSNVAAVAPVQPPAQSQQSQDGFGAPPAPNFNSDAGSGSGSDSGSTNTATGYAVSADQAVIIALSIVPSATLTQQPRLVNLNGSIAYEVALDSGNVYVDAQSGQVLYSTAGSQSQRPRQRFHRPGR